MQQFYRIKSEHPDAMLLFRMGDFYETFDDDALRASEILGIALTKRANGAAMTVPLAGFPHHALEKHLPKLIKAGLRVAICEQLENPKYARKLVKRGVVEVVTPGVSLRDQLLTPKQSNFLVAVHLTRHSAGVAYVDVSTGTFEVTESPREQLDDLLQSLAPAEVLVNRVDQAMVRRLRKIDYTVTPREDWVFTLDYARTSLTEYFGTHSLKGFGVDDMTAGLVAAAAILNYLTETQHGRLTHLRTLRRTADGGHMVLDSQTRRNLELVDLTADGQVDGALTKLLDRTVTAMGGRCLRNWLLRPLLRADRINRRLSAVEALVNAADLRDRIRELLNEVCDVERVVARVAVQRSTIRELLALAHALRQVPQLKSVAETTGCEPLLDLAKRLHDCPQVEQLIAEAFGPGEPTEFRTGYNAELDELRGLATGGKAFIEKLQVRESERTGIPSLKVGFNKVFGYYLEITNAHKDKVPPEYVRKQTLVNAERFVTPELKEWEDKVLTAQERIEVLEAELLRNLRAQVAEHAEDLQCTGNLLARLDCVATFADVAVLFRYVCPQVDESRQLRILQGRHPVVEQAVSEGFIPNSVDVDPGTTQIYLITGPNMAGKSVVLRQVGMIVLMAQVGSFVPAESARIGVVDRIFTRVGASDNLAAGESTFLVEMNETANILNNATRRSLILLDEVGRGTSTFDGLSIAWALVEHLHDRENVAARTLFATHYHELNELEERCQRVKSFRIKVQEHEGQLVFLRKLVPGAADHSYGIEVGSMAGLPPSLLQRAREILSELEGQKIAFDPSAPSNTAVQLPLFAFEGPDGLRDRLAELDPDRMTPIEALLALVELKALANS